MTSARTCSRSRSWSRSLALIVLLVAAAPVARAATSPAAADSADALRPDPAVRGWQTGLLRADRLQHASLAFTLGLGAGAVSREPGVAIAVPAVLGLAKEVADRGTAGFDRADLLADLIGAALAGWVTSRVAR